MLEAAFVELESAGWIPQGARDDIRLLYRKDDVTAGHTDHMHVGMRSLEPIVERLRILPKTLQRKSNGQYISANLEFVGGVDVTAIDHTDIYLIVNGYTLVQAEAAGMEISDSDGNGVVDLTVKFDRAAVADTVEAGEVEMAVAGSMNGVYFQSSDWITVK